MPEYLWIYQNMHEWLFFTFPHCNPLSEGNINCFLEETKYIFFYSSPEHLISFLFWTKYFASKIWNLLLPLRAEGWGLWILIHTINISMMFFWWFIYLYLLLLFSTFWCFKGLNQRFTKTVVVVNGQFWDTFIQSQSKRKPSFP